MRGSNGNRQVTPLEKLREGDEDTTKALVNFIFLCFYKNMFYFFLDF